MLVEVGPVPAASVLAWTSYAGSVVDDLRDLADDVAPPVDLAALDAFARYLDEWRAVAQRCDPFRWSADLDPATVEYLLHAWFVVANRLAASAERRGVVLSPAEGEPFYQAVVGAVLDALAGEGRSPAQFSDHLRSFWPGLEPGAPSDG
ncbi:MAG TPA: hypothetical protein VGB14_04115 [Acidimicrobiales bacterium]|jgi:hypothetical protein